MNIRVSEKAVLYRINKINNQENNTTIGACIRKERMAQGLKQESVCKDICSVSYYSRIESNKIIPSNWYISKIFKKLNRPIPENLTHEGNKHNKEIINNFLTAIEYKNNKLIEEEYEKIKKLPDIFLELYEFVYYINHNKINELETIIQKLHAQQIHFENEELLLYLENIGIYYILINEIIKAEKYLSLSMKLQDTMNITKPSILYRYAWVLGKLNNDYQCINYAEEADGLFLRSYNVYRSIQCKLLIGIKLSKYFPERAIMIYEECLKITSNSNFGVLNKNIKFNLALVFKKNKEYDKSEDIFLELIRNHNKDSDFVFELYVELIDLHILNNKIEQARKYYKVINNSHMEKENRSIYLKYFQYKLFNHDINKTVQMYNMTFIPYFTNINNIAMIIRSRKELANLYEGIGDLERSINEYKNLYNLIKKEKII
ncbi:helix-turn-helix transcriptional regulator [Mycoplasmatota bacterium]|nr:helix-turn-helix transcriptional regulator [Mycoplasmatota bacterium]